MRRIFQVSPCDVGRGVFATRNAEAGQRIHRFTGRLITKDEVLLKAHSTMNPLQISPVLYIDLCFPGVMFNHSCNPNAGIHSDIFLQALRPIAKGEEIRFDYSTTMDEEHETMPCCCGHSSCRKTIGDFGHIPARVRRKYLSLNIVQSFIRVRYGMDRQQ